MLIQAGLDSVLVLFRNYPGDPVLQVYLKYAIQHGLLSLSTFVATFLSAARSPDLHKAATLDILCRVALDAHYASGMPAIGSLVSFTESMVAVLATVQDAMALLRVAHSLPVSHFHQLTTSASELLILLISCVADLAQIPTSQAALIFANANDLLQMRLSPEVRQVLENLVLSLSLIIGDDAKAAREAQMVHSMQLALGKNDILGRGSDADIITCSLVLHSLVCINNLFIHILTQFFMVDVEKSTRVWVRRWSPRCRYTDGSVEVVILDSTSLFLPATSIGHYVPSAKCIFRWDEIGSALESIHSRSGITLVCFMLKSQSLIPMVTATTYSV